MGVSGISDNAIPFEVMEFCVAFIDYVLELTALDPGSTGALEESQRKELQLRAFKLANSAAAHRDAELQTLSRILERTPISFDANTLLEKLVTLGVVEDCEDKAESCSPHAIRENISIEAICRLIHFLVQESGGPGVAKSN